MFFTMDQKPEHGYALKTINNVSYRKKMERARVTDNIVSQKYTSKLSDIVTIMPGLHASATKGVIHKNIWRLSNF